MGRIVRLISDILSRKNMKNLFKKIACFFGFHGNEMKAWKESSSFGTMYYMERICPTCGKVHVHKEDFMR